MSTMEQKMAMLEAIRAIADTIKELKEVPNGHLYARVMSYMSIDTYNSIINMLVKGQLIRNENHLLIWNITEKI